MRIFFSLFSALLLATSTANAIGSGSVVESAGYGIWMNPDVAERSLQVNAEQFCSMRTPELPTPVRISDVETEYFFDGGVNKFRLKAEFSCEIVDPDNN